MKLFASALLVVALCACARGARHPSAMTKPAAFGLDCGQPAGSAAVETTLQLPSPWVVERAELDALVRESAPIAVSEAWRSDPNGCEHRYRMRLSAAGIRGRLERLAQTLAVTLRVEPTGIRLATEADTMAIHVFLAPVLDSVATVDIGIVHHGIDGAACVRAAIGTLPSSLRSTDALASTGATASFAQSRRAEGERPWCEVRYKLPAHDEVTLGKVRAWIEQRGHSVDPSWRFAWDDGGQGSVVWDEVTFDTRPLR